jgi:hypothetical protein
MDSDYEPAPPQAEQDSSDWSSDGGRQRKRARGGEGRGGARARPARNGSRPSRRRAAASQSQPADAGGDEEAHLPEAAAPRAGGRRKRGGSGGAGAGAAAAGTGAGRGATRVSSTDAMERQLIECVAKFNIDASRPRPGH